MSAKNNKCNKIQQLDEVKGKEGLGISANIAKVTRIFLASKNHSLQISQKSQE